MSHTSHIVGVRLMEHMVVNLDWQLLPKGICLGTWDWHWFWNWLVKVKMILEVTPLGEFRYVPSERVPHRFWGLGIPIQSPTAFLGIFTVHGYCYGFLKKFCIILASATTVLAGVGLSPFPVNIVVFGTALSILFLFF